jgi:hypothetical protein
MSLLISPTRSRRLRGDTSTRIAARDPVQDSHARSDASAFPAPVEVGMHASLRIESE